MSFKNKVVIVTGASSGIGASVAELFSAEGASVVLVGRNKTKLAAVAELCNNPLVLRADVSNDDDARRIIDQTIKEFGQLDVLVNNAGIGNLSGSILEGDIMRAFDSVMSINLRAVVYLTTLAAPHLIKIKGNIVNISSVVGKIMPIIPNFISYHISKAGLNHFSTCAALELGRKGVRVNVISPGPVRTDFLQNAKLDMNWDNTKKMTVLERVSEPQEIAHLVLYLASEKANGITASNYVIDNGLSICRNELTENLIFL